MYARLSLHLRCDKWISRSCAARRDTCESTNIFSLSCSGSKTHLPSSNSRRRVRRKNRDRWQRFSGRISNAPRYRRVRCGRAFRLQARMEEDLLSGIFSGATKRVDAETLVSFHEFPCRSSTNATTSRSQRWSLAILFARECVRAELLALSRITMNNEKRFVLATPGVAISSAPFLFHCTVIPFPAAIGPIESRDSD